MEERPPGGVPDQAGRSGFVPGWLSSSPVVGGTFGPQHSDITERILRHTGGADGGAPRFSLDQGSADQQTVASLPESWRGTERVDGRYPTSAASLFAGATTSGALRSMQRDFDLQSAARGLTGVLGQTADDLRGAEGGGQTSGGRLLPRRLQLHALVNEVVSRSMRPPRSRSQPSRVDVDIIEALLQLDPESTEDDLAFELKAHAATEEKAASYHAELKQMLSEARSAGQDLTPVLGVEPRAYTTTHQSGSVAEAFGQWTGASLTASIYEPFPFSFHPGAPAQPPSERGRSPVQFGSRQQPSSRPSSRLPSRSRSSQHVAVQGGELW